MAFYFNNKLSVDIENKQYTIDLSTNKVIEAIKKIREDSILMSKKEDVKENDIEGYLVNLKDFIMKTVGEQEFEEIFKDKQYAFSDLSELVQYILLEIEKFKKEKINRINSNPTPKKIS